MIEQSTTSNRSTTPTSERFRAFVRERWAPREEDAAPTRVAATYAEGPLRARLARYHAHVDDAFHGWADTWLDPAFLHWSLDAEAHAFGRFFGSADQREGMGAFVEKRSPKFII